MNTFARVYLIYKLCCRGIAADNILVRCGEGDTIVEGQSQDRRASTDMTNPIIHPKYTLTSKDVPEYDIALIKVNEEFDLNPNANKVCLPSGLSDWRGKINPKDCYATGFGKDEFGK